MIYKGQLRLVDSPLQVTIWAKRLRAVDFTLGYEVRSVRRPDVQAGRDRRVATGCGAHRGAAVGATVASSSGVPAAVVRVADRGLWLGPDASCPPRGSRYVRGSRDTPRRCRGHPTPRPLGGTGDGLGGNGFRCVGQSRGGRQGPARRHVGRRRRVGARAGRRKNPATAMSTRASRWTRRGGVVCRPESGFTHLEDIPAKVMMDLAQSGAQLAREHGSAHGPPVSLLDQEVIEVSSGDTAVGLPMRCVFALTAMGFLPQSADAIDDDEMIRVRSCRPGCASTHGSVRCTDGAVTRHW